MCGGGGGKRDLKKHREQNYAISSQHWVCKFEEMGWDMFLRKKGIFCALSHKLIGGGGGVATLFKMGLRCILACYFVKIEIVFGCRSSKNLLIHQDLFF